MSKLREKVVQRLAEAGYTVSPDEIYPAKGHYRSSRFADVCRWEAFGAKGIRKVTIQCWDTMTACARHGIDFYADDGLVIQACAKTRKAMPDPK